MKKILYHVQSFMKSLAHLFVVLGGTSLVAAFVFWLLHDDSFGLLAFVGVVTMIASLAPWICFWVIRKVSSRYVSVEEITIIEKQRKVLSTEDYHKKIAVLSKKTGYIILGSIALGFLLGLIGGEFSITGFALPLYGIPAGILYFVVNFLALTGSFFANRSSGRTIK